MRRFLVVAVAVLLVCAVCSAGERIPALEEVRGASADQMHAVGTGLLLGGLCVILAGVSLVGSSKTQPDFSTSAGMLSAGGVALSVGGVVLSLSGGILLGHAAK